MGKFIIGLILGVAIAGGLAFYLSYTPNQIVNKVTNSGVTPRTVNNPVPIVLAPGTKLQVSSEVVPKNASQGVAPSYDFYNILPGNKAKETKVNASAAVANKLAPSSIFMVQAGVFTDQDEANDMKARLALLGIDSQIKSQQKGGQVINKVIIGPFATDDEANEVLARLNDENIQGVVIKAINASNASN
jgi:cell division protein FtsN